MYQKLKRFYLILCISVVPFILVACGKSPEEKAIAQQKQAGSMMTIGLLINLVVCVPTLLKAIQKQHNSEMGTNAVTRFVRRGVGNLWAKQFYGRMTALLVVDILFLFILPFKFSPIKLLDFIPPIGTIAFLIFWMNRTRKDKQRVKDARAVTKGSLQVGAGAAKGVAMAGAVAAAPVTGGASLAVGAAVVAGAGVAGSVMDTAQKNMGNELAHDFDQQQIAGAVAGGLTQGLQQSSQKVAQIADTELFKKKALRLGCNENMSLGEMAQVVLKYAPAASTKELPEGLSDEEKAVALLGAYKQQAKAIAQKVIEQKVTPQSAPTQEPVVIDGEFREVSSDPKG